MTPREREALAVHEAGHGVIAELLKLPTKSVGIIRGSTYAGRSLLSTNIGCLPPWKIATWALAGPEAEKRFRQAPHARLGAEDYQFVRALLEATREPDEDVDVLGRRYEGLAAGFVLVHESWITRVARQLCVENILSAEVVRDLRPEKG